MPNDQPITITVSAADYQRIVELAYLGEWFINSHHDTEFQDDAASDVLQKVLAVQPLALVGRDVETGNYYLESEWTERLYDQYISDYDDHVFWDELIERLAQRDLAKSRGVSPDEINREEDLRELRPLEDRYREELEGNGVERLEITDGF